MKEGLGSWVSAESAILRVSHGPIILSYMNLGKLLNVFKPPFAHLYN